MDFIVDFLIVAVFALCIFVGVKNGLIRSIIGLVVVAAAAGLPRGPGRTPDAVERTRRKRYI